MSVQRGTRARAESLAGRAKVLSRSRLIEYQGTSDAVLFEMIADLADVVADLAQSRRVGDVTRMGPGVYQVTPADELEGRL